MSSGILIHPAIWSRDMARKMGSCAPFGEGELGPYLTLARAEAYLHAKFHLETSNRLATAHQRHRQDRTVR